jgi:hypothetical protein
LCQQQGAAEHRYQIFIHADLLITSMFASYGTPTAVSSEKIEANRRGYGEWLWLSAMTMPEDRFAAADIAWCRNFLILTI